MRTVVQQLSAQLKTQVKTQSLYIHADKVHVARTSIVGPRI